MEKTLEYLQETLGIQTLAKPLAKSYLDKLPLYIHEMYKLYQTDLFNTEFILAELKCDDEMSIQQIGKQSQQIKTLLHQNVVVVLNTIQAYSRKRLIEKGISFIVPGRQMYMPDLLMDLRESFIHPKTKHTSETLLPSAQFLLIYHIIHRNENHKLEDRSFKDIAQKLGYTPMAISNAIDNLKHHALVEVQGQKEKYIQFRYPRSELWNITHQQNMLTNPVIKTVFVDEIPKKLSLLQSNASALPAYTDMNPSRQPYFAIEKAAFYNLQKHNALLNLNDYEGNFALEVWKYNPLNLVGDLQNEVKVVDPISLYLSVMNNRDERIQLAADQIIKKYGSMPLIVGY